MFNLIESNVIYNIKTNFQIDSIDFGKKIFFQKHNSRIDSTIFLNCATRNATFAPSFIQTS